MAQSRINLWRRITQTLSVFLLNPYLYTYRQVCFPILNCWGCPVSAFSCPIGALGQFFAHGVFPFIVLGTVILFGALMGRMLCGWVCPFGLIQDLLYKIRTRKIKMPGFLNYGKYATLAIMVVFIPIFFGVDLIPGQVTVSKFFFCNYCPAGTLEANIPLTIMAANASTTDTSAVDAQRFSETPQKSVFLTFLTSVRFWILMGLLVLFIFISRVFCRALCPIGAMFALLNKLSIFKLRINEEKCNKCNVCYKVCPTSVYTNITPNSPECVRCLVCQDKCPSKAIENQYF